MGVCIHISLLLESEDEWATLYDLLHCYGGEPIYVYPEEPWVEKHMDELIRQRCDNCPWDILINGDTTECRKEFAKTLFCSKLERFGANIPLRYRQKLAERYSRARELSMRLNKPLSAVLKGGNVE